MHLRSGSPWLLVLACPSAPRIVSVSTASFHSNQSRLTLSAVGALIGVGIAAGGAGSVKWGWDNGVAFVFASVGLGLILLSFNFSPRLQWVIAPCIAGGFAAIVFLITKFLVSQAVHHCSTVLTIL